MSERIDHVAEAVKSLAGSGDVRNLATDASANAVAYAVLALVEQQRIANQMFAHTHGGDHSLSESDQIALWGQVVNNGPQIF